MNVFFPRDVPDDAAGAGSFVGYPLHVIVVARDEGDVRAAVAQLADEREPQARRATGNGDAQAG